MYDVHIVSTDLVKVMERFLIEELKERKELLPKNDLEIEKC